MPGPGLVGRCGYESDPGLPGTDDAEFSLPNGRAVPGPCDMVIEK